MRKLSRMNPARIRHPITGDAGDEYNGTFQIGLGGVLLTVIASNGMGWDHVSVSHPLRTPTWAEMCAIKKLFFHDDETVVQFHPAQERYINVHEHCLHLWRWQGGEFPLPAVVMV